jgi:hypothetical protein
MVDRQTRYCAWITIFYTLSAFLYAERMNKDHKPTHINLVTVLYKFPSPPPGVTQPIVGVYFTALYRALASSSTRLLDHTQRRATVGRTPLNE